MQHNASLITNTLRMAGIRPSVHRIAVMRYLTTNRIHPTAEDIFKALIVEYPTMSRTTIYNTLHLLSEKNCVRTIDIDKNNTRFDIDTIPHAHCMCTGCGIIFDAPLTNTPAPPDGFKCSDTQVLFKGLCEKCKDINS